MMNTTSGSSWSAPALWAATALAVGVALGALLGGGPRTVFAVASASDESFAVCTTPIDNNVEGLFILDFETGDLSGGVLNPGTSKFTAGYRHNVLKDLGFKPGKVQNPKFLLASGVLAFTGQASSRLAPSVLYVTDASTGVTVAYGIPWNTTAGTGAGAGMAPLVILDRVAPRGGGDKAP